MSRFSVTCCVGLALASLFGRAADAAVTVYDLVSNGGGAGFNAAIGVPLASINFDDIAANTNITGTTISGVTFNSPAGGAPLMVVEGSSTFTPAGFNGAPDPSTNKLGATTGANVLSPGGIELGPGPNDPLENDDLELVFQPGVTAFAFDHLSQSADGITFTAIGVFNQVNALLFSGVVPISNISGAGGPAAADFWGIIADGGDVIGRIVVDEFDNDNNFPDSNIGFDSLRLAPVPEPASLLLAGAAGVATLLATRRRRRQSAR